MDDERSFLLPRALSGVLTKRSWLALAAGVLLAGPAWAQGQESTTSAQAPQTSPHPVPLLSDQDVTSVPSGKVLAGSPLPDDMRPRKPDAFGMAGPVTIPQVQLACDAIQDDTAKSRCQARSSPAAPPKGGPD